MEKVCYYEGSSFEKEDREDVIPERAPLDTGYVLPSIVQGAFTPGKR